MRNSNVIYLELNCLSGIELEPGPKGWRCYDSVVTEGSGVDELLANAEAFMTDQDGGCAGSHLFDDLPEDLQKTVCEAIHDKLVEMARPNRASTSNELEREQRGRESEVVRGLGDL